MESEIVFEILKDILKPYEKQLQVVYDKPDNYYLHTPPSDKNKKGEFFGAVQIKKSYVAFHLMPIYYNPDLLTGISHELKNKMQGKSCFNFTSGQKGLFNELAALTKTSFDDYKAKGKV